MIDLFINSMARVTLICLRADVTICEPDFMVSIDAPSASPNDPDYPQQYDMNLVQVQKIWQQADFGSSTVQVCVVSPQASAGKHAAV